MRNRLETNRLILRPFLQTDWKSLVNYAGDNQVARATGRLPHPYNYADARNWISLAQVPASNHVYGIALKDDHLIGCVSLTETETSWELGYWLGQAHWHKGYMREACSALLAEAKKKLGSARLSANVFTDNPRSLALLKHLGFTLTRQSTEFCVARGHNVDTHMLILSLVANHA